MIKIGKRAWLVCMLLIFAAAPAGARTKLAALPEREAVTIRFDHPEATLIEEQRVLTLQEGINLVDFSWRGVQIDPDSIRLAILGRPDRVTLLSVAYPPKESALVWRIHSKGAWEEKVRITYLLAQVDCLVAYRALAAKDEKTLDLEGFLVLRNFSGEDFATVAVDLGQGPLFSGRVSHEETRQVLLLSAKRIPVRKTFTWDAEKMPWEPKRSDREAGIPVHYEIVNDRTSGLGASALRAGKIRVFQDDGKEGAIFLGEDAAPQTPVSQTMRIHIGDSRDVAVTQRKTKERAFNHRPSKFKTALYDREEVVEAEVENFKDAAVTVDLIQRIQGEWRILEASLPFERKDAQTLVFPVSVGGKGSRSLTFRYERLNIRP